MKALSKIKCSGKQKAEMSSAGKENKQLNTLVNDFLTFCRGHNNDFAISGEDKDCSLY